MTRAFMAAKAWGVLDRLAVIGIVVCLASVLYRSAVPEAISARRADAAFEPASGVFSANVIRTAAARGNAAASVLLVEWGDFECAYCRQFAGSAYPSIQREFVETGLVRYIYLNNPLEKIHGHAVLAGEAAACAGEAGKFWQIHDNVLTSGTATLDEAALLKYGTAVGLDETTFRTCIESGRMGERVRSEQKEGSKFGVEGTPHFVVATAARGTIVAKFRIRGARSLETFQAALRETLDSQRFSSRFARWWRRIGGSPEGRGNQ